MNIKLNETIFEQFPTLETERLVLRAFTIEDSGELFEMRSNEQIMKYMDTDPLKTVDEAKDMIEKINLNFADRASINWIIEERNSGKVIGYVLFKFFDRHNNRTEIGYALKPLYWGKGFIKEILIRVIDFAFNELKVHSIIGNTNDKNIASQKVMEKLGFQREAHFREDYFYNGQFLDSVIYGLIESDWKKNI